MRIYLKSDIVDRDNTLFIYRPEGVGHLTESKYLHRKELDGVLPRHRVCDYVFPFQGTTLIECDKAVGKKLLAKYLDLAIYDKESGKQTTIEDDLDSYKYSELMTKLAKHNKLASEFGIEHQPLTGKADAFREKIRAFRRMGVVLEEDIGLVDKLCIEELEKLKALKAE